MGIIEDKETGKCYLYVCFSLCQKAQYDRRQLFVFLMS